MTHGRGAGRSRRHAARSWAVCWVLVAGVLFFWRWDILDSPPYWDAIYGLWMEANFLEVTDFDYERLRYAEKHGTIGGAYSYMTSVMPTLLALALRIIENDHLVLVLYHGFNLLCAAAIGASLWSLLRRVAGGLGASLCTAALLTTPVFSAQMDMASMELPLTLLVLTSAQLAWKERWFSSSLASFGAFLVKQTGLLLTVVNAGILLLILLLFRTRRFERALACAVSIVILIMDGLIIQWGGTLRFHLDPRNRPEIAGPSSAWVWFPDLVILVTITIAFNCWEFVQLYERLFRRDENEPLRRRFRRLSRLILRSEVLRLYAWMFIVIVLLATTRVVLIPRYVIVTLPFLYLIVGRTLSRNGMMSRLGLSLIACVVAFNLFNQHGAFYPDISTGIGPEYARTGAMLERSLEYRRDHEANIAAMRTLAEQSGGNPIFAGHPFVYMLAIPRMGYVTQAQQGYAINEFSSSFPQFRDILQADYRHLPRDPIFVHVPSTYYFKSLQLTVPFPQSKDDVLFDDGHEPPLVVFRTKVPTTAVENWYLQRLLPWATPEERARVIARYFESIGAMEQSVSALETGLDAYIPSASLACEVSRKYWALGHRDKSITALLAVIPLAAGRSGDSRLASIANPRSVDVIVETLQEGITAGTEIAELQTIVADARSVATDRAYAALALGVHHYRRGDFAQAIASLRIAIENDAQIAETYRYLGLALLQTGDVTGAATALEQGIKLRSHDASLQAALGLVHAKQGNWEAARRQFNAALELNPALKSASRDLERIETEITAPGRSAQQGFDDPS